MANPDNLPVPREHPQDYTFITWVDNASVALSAQLLHGLGVDTKKCYFTGSRLRYATILEHLSTKKLVAVGEGNSPITHLYSPYQATAAFQTNLIDQLQHKAQDVIVQGNVLSWRLVNHMGGSRTMMMVVAGEIQGVPVQGTYRMLVPIPRDYTPHRGDTVMFMGKMFKRNTSVYPGIPQGYWPQVGYIRKFKKI